MQAKQICVLGKDQRIGYLKDKMTEQLVSFEAITTSEQCQLLLHSMDIIILPLPAVHKSGVIHSVEGELAPEQLVDLISPGALVIGGLLSPSFRKLMEDREISWFDYFDCEELTVLNAMITAEGAVALAMDHTPFSLYDSRILITGYGRISRCLVGILQGFGAREILVAARSPKDRQWASIDGAKPLELHSIYKEIERVDLVFNTIPQLVITEDLLWLAKKDCLVLDLASAPGGVDFEAAKQLGIRAIWQLGIPSKAAPKTAGEGIYHAIKHLL